MTWEEYIIQNWELGKKNGKKDDGSPTWIIDFSDYKRALEVRDEAVKLGVVNAQLRDPKHPLNTSKRWWEIYPGEEENNTSLLD